MKFLWQVQLDYATYGIIEEDCYIIDAAPIGRWLIGHSIEDMIAWVTSKHGKFVNVTQLPKDA